MIQQRAIRNVPIERVVKVAHPSFFFFLFFSMLALPEVQPLRLCVFGSDNKFASEAVSNRLTTIKALLLKEGISVLTYSADGDSRELKVMRSELKLNVVNPQNCNPHVTSKFK